MEAETRVILRSALYGVMTAKSLKEAEISIKVMCTKDDIAAVKERVDEKKKCEANQ